MQELSGRTRVSALTILAGLGLALTLTAAVPARAQEQAASLDRVDAKVKAGQTLRVEDTKGHVVTGKLTAIDATSLTLEDEGRKQRWRFAVDDIRRVEKPDGLWSGLLIGLASGMVGGAAMCDCLGGDCCDGQGWAAGLGYGALGAGIGALVDALVGPKVLFQAPGTRAEPVKLRDIAIGFTVGRGREEEDYFLSGQSWAATVRIGLKKHLALDVEIAGWGGSSRVDYTDAWTWGNPGVFVNGAFVPAEAPEPSQRVVILDVSEGHLGAQAVARFPLGRVSFSGGGGLGLWGQNTFFVYQEYSLVNDDHWLAEQRSEHRFGLGALGSVGVDLALTRRLALSGTGGVQFVPTLDTLLFTFQGGMRVTF